VFLADLELAGSVGGSAAIYYPEGGRNIGSVVGGKAARPDPSSGVPNTGNLHPV